jgi:hypothetical protein
MLEHVLAARRRVMNEPRFLEFEPLLGSEVVEAVAERLFGRGHG